MAWAAVFALLARNAPVAVRPRGIGPMLAVLTRERLAWVLALFYFLTFGGFVAFSIYLPSLLKDEFGLGPADAGFRTAGFVVLATLQPSGGRLAVGPHRRRASACGVFLRAWCPSRCCWRGPAWFRSPWARWAAPSLLGLGNGAVFKLVPQYFPVETGTVTGLVGAMGGLGGFFPPLLLGLFRDRMGVVWPGFVLLAARLWRCRA